MEDLKVKQPANEPLLDAPAVRGRFPRLLSEPAVLTSTLSEKGEKGTGSRGIFNQRAIPGARGHKARDAGDGS